MKYLKIFESFDNKFKKIESSNLKLNSLKNIQLYKDDIDNILYTIFKDTFKTNPKENNIFLSFTLNLTNTLQYNLFFNQDEYFYISIILDNDQYIIKCDQLDGLKECLKYIKSNLPYYNKDTKIYNDLINQYNSLKEEYNRQQILNDTSYLNTEKEMNKLLKRRLKYIGKYVKNVKNIFEKL